MKECKYRLPCDWCDKFDKKCEEIDYYVLQKPKECNHDWILEEQEIVNQKVCYKTYKCSICKKRHIRKDELLKDGSVNTTIWYE